MLSSSSDSDVGNTRKLILKVISGIESDQGPYLGVRWAEAPPDGTEVNSGVLLSPEGVILPRSRLTHPVS